MHSAVHATYEQWWMYEWLAASALPCPRWLSWCLVLTSTCLFMRAGSVNKAENEGCFCQKPALAHCSLWYVGLGGLQLNGFWLVPCAAACAKPLRSHCDSYHPHQVSKGQSVIIPGGWPYALVAPKDALLVGAQVCAIFARYPSCAAWPAYASTHQISRPFAPSIRHLAHVSVVCCSCCMPTT